MQAARLNKATAPVPGEEEKSGTPELSHTPIPLARHRTLDTAPGFDIIPREVNAAQVAELADALL